MRRSNVPGRAGAFLTFGAAFEIWRKGGVGWLRYDYRAWRRGRHAAWLPAMPWEELLSMRLSTVRALLGIEASATAHPDGILRADSTDNLRFEAAA